MIRFVSLFLIITYSANAQSDWQKIVIDRNVAIQFPFNPTLQSTADFYRYTLRHFEIDLVAYIAPYRGDYKKRVSNSDELRGFYKWVLDVNIKTINGSARYSDYEMQDDIMFLKSRYVVGRSRCECRILFAKDTLYQISMCADQDKRSFDSTATRFFNSISINSDLTSADQMTRTGATVEASTLILAGRIMGYFGLASFLTWAILLVTLIFRQDAGPIRILFSIIRWTNVVAFLTVCLFFLVGHIGNIVNEQTADNNLLIGAAITGAVGFIVLLIKPPSKSNAVV